jgi:gliding motility-associated-like protein
MGVMTLLHYISLLLASSLATGPYATSELVMEICDNALDDDGDGLIDLNDADCDCPVIEPESLIPNPSFEEMNCCPSNRSQLHCADTWIQASVPTTDYIHNCGWLGWTEFPAPQPFPDGDGIVGFRDGRVLGGGGEMNWKEYAGACLLSPLQRNTAYRFEFHVGFVNRQSSPPIDITFFGTSDCNNLPFGQGNQAFGCPTNGPGWVRLGSTRVSGSRWVKASIEVTPGEPINAIAIGPACPGVPSDVSLYYFFDNLVLADQRAFGFQISEAGHPCNSDFQLEIPFESGIAYQWYKNGIALPGETSTQVNAMVYGEGDYQVRMLGNGACVVTRVYSYDIPSIQSFAQERICEGDVYVFGTQQLTIPGSYVETLKSKDNCDSTVSLTLHVQPRAADSVRAWIFDGDRYDIGTYSFREAGNYDLPFISSIGCDSIVNLDLNYYSVYIPNVFSPNDDGVNDLFNVGRAHDLVTVRSLRLFDRWGNVVYEGKDLTPGLVQGWDGRHDGHVASSGVYVYQAVLIMDDGFERYFTGAVTLVR